MHIASMSLGIFDFLIEWIASLVGTVIGWFFDIVMQIVNRMIYSIAKQILFIVDAIQVLFRRLAGLDKYWIIENGQSVEKEGDILISLMSNETILEVFITLTLVAVAMVIIATIIKVVQSEFTTEGSKNSKGGIIGQAIKSLIMFMLVPVLCFGGVLVSNALLKALDGATSNGGSESMASQVFVSAASSANKVRLGWFKLDDEAVEFINNGQPFNNVSQAANAIDNAFRTKKDYKKNPPANAGGIVETIVNTIFSSGPGMIASGVSTIGVATYENIYMVGTYYDIGQMNMIIMIGGAVMACYVMLVTSFGLVMRLFKAAILFMISPPVIAIAPLDKGNAFQSWRKQFVSEVLAGYGAILGLNLFFIIMPILNNINLFPDLGGATSLTGTTPGADVSITFGGFGGTIYNDLAHLLFTLVGLYMMKDLIKMIGNIAGGSDAMGAGEGMAKKAGSAALKVGMAVATGGAALASGIGGAVAAGKASKAGGIADKLEKRVAYAKKGLGGNAKSLSTLEGERASLVEKAKAAGGTKTAEGKKYMQEVLAKNKEIKEHKAAASGTDKRAALLRELDKSEPEAIAQRQRANEQESKSSARVSRAKGMGKNLLAEGMGRVSKGINSMFGTKLNEETTIKGREDERDKRSEAAANRIMDGKGSGMDYATIGHSKKIKETQEAYQRGVQALGGNDLRNSLGDTSKVQLANLDDLGGAIASAMEHMNNAAEGEQSQQIWRGIYEQLKAISDVKNSGDSGLANAMLSQLQKNTSEGGITHKALSDLNIQGKIEAEIKTKLQSSAPQSADALKKSIEQAVKNNGVSKAEINAMTDKILKKMMEEISKVAPK